MKLDFYQPKNKILQKYIEGYYFISDHQRSGPVKYLTFPNNFCILSVNFNSTILLKDHCIVVKPSRENRISANLVFRYNYPIEVVCESPVNEITIYFKPLGLHHFSTDLDAIFAERKNLENYDPFPDFKSEMRHIFSGQEEKERIELLENYWLSKFSEKDLSLAERILADVEADLKIEEIAQKQCFSRQYINKVFSNSIGKTPSEYRKIHRFRTSLFNHEKSKNLTELSHGTLFYDQSHFIKDFKSFTDRSPRTFFKNVDTQKGNIWLFI